MLKGKGLVIPLVAMTNLFSSIDRACKSVMDGPIGRVDLQLHDVPKGTPMVLRITLITIGVMLTSTPLPMTTYDHALVFILA